MLLKQAYLIRCEYNYWCKKLLLSKVCCSGNRLTDIDMPRLAMFAALTVTVVQATLSKHQYGKGDKVTSN